MADPLPAAIQDFDVVSATPEEFARALFDRPIATQDEVWDVLGERGEFDPWFYDKAGFVRACTAMFQRFGALSDPYSFEQVEQGLGLIHSYPYFLAFYLIDSEVLRGDAIECARAAFCLYQDYLAKRNPPGGSGALYMWWDNAWTGAGEPFFEAVLETLQRILGLGHKACDEAALHGLSHLHEYLPEGVETVYGRYRAGLGVTSP